MAIDSDLFKMYLAAKSKPNFYSTTNRFLSKFDVEREEKKKKEKELLENILKFGGKIPADLQEEPSLIQKILGTKLSKEEKAPYKSAIELYGTTKGEAQGQLGYEKNIKETEARRETGIKERETGIKEREIAVKEQQMRNKNQWEIDKIKIAQERNRIAASKDKDTAFNLKIYDMVIEEEKNEWMMVFSGDAEPKTLAERDERRMKRYEQLLKELKPTAPGEKEPPAVKTGRQKAIEWLSQKKERLTEPNIDAVIKKFGW